jgi:hypothetical protein
MDYNQFRNSNEYYLRQTGKENVELIRKGKYALINLLVSICAIGLQLYVVRALPSEIHSKTLEMIFAFFRLVHFGDLENDSATAGPLLYLHTLTFVS